MMDFIRLNCLLLISHLFMLQSFGHELGTRLAYKTKKIDRLPNTESKYVSRVSKPARFYAGIGTSWGSSYLFPVAHFQWVVNRQFAIGSQLFYTDNFNSASHRWAIGGYLTSTYYLKRIPFTGTFAQAGLGYGYMKAVSDGHVDNSNPLLFMGTFGWRGISRIGVTLSIAAGFQFIHHPEETAIKFSGVLPLLSGEIGFPF